MKLKNAVADARGLVLSSNWLFHLYSEKVSTQP